jgi:hypothetical protein
VTRPRPEWAGDSGLIRHLQEAVRYLLRGQYEYDRRMKVAMGHLLILRSGEFPADLQPHFSVIQETARQATIEGATTTMVRYKGLVPAQRDAFAAALLALYDAAVGDRAVLETSRFKKRSKPGVELGTT